MRFTCPVTYSEVTPESAVDGDYSDAGYIDEAREFECLRDLVRFICDEGFTEPSDSGDSPRWLSQEPYTSDFRTGTERSEAIHLDSISPRNRARIMRLAR